MEREEKKGKADAKGKGGGIGGDFKFFRYKKEKIGKEEAFLGKKKGQSPGKKKKVGERKREGFLEWNQRGKPYGRDFSGPALNEKRGVPT